MIALLVGLASKNWRIAVAAGFGFAFCWPVASCQGKREAQAAYALKVQAAAEKVKAAASKAELAAALADMARASKSKEEAQELREIINETQSDAGVGPATSALLGELRKRRNR
ncbi:hypothetical protein [Sphingobium naphthae]|uniref:Uncharacterized protein n=1 Tax=Sphingobium naphthae TaxID=1886786 RepID=A0ABU3ZRY7_9SPHN|nr:hypothetical protein [Sphingobium naphthae]MDV5822284.1 hypothetical protein [Sphingobium naphthae]